LLQEGLAQSTRTSKFEKEFLEAEQKAKTERKRLWHDYDPAKEIPVKRQEQVATAAKSPQKELLLVTDIIDGSCCYAQVIGEGQKKLEAVMQRIAESNPDSKQPHSPHAGEAVLAKFSGDGLWYRAKVTGSNRQGSRVFYGDYGNSDAVDGANIRQLPRELGLDVLPWQAQECHLAYILPRPVDEEWGTEAAVAFEDLVRKGTMVATIEYVDGDAWHVSLLVPDGKSFVNGELVKAGLAKVVRNPPRSANKEVIEYLRAEQEDAHRHHRGIWEHGDDGEEDEYEDRREFGRSGRPQVKKGK